MANLKSFPFARLPLTRQSAVSLEEVKSTPRSLIEPGEYEAIYHSLAVPDSKLVASKVAKKGRTTSRQGPKATLSRKKRKGKARAKTGKSFRRSPLRDVSAASISLQDAADFAGAVWKYGKYALAMLNVETKESYNLTANATIVNTTIYNLINIAQGSDYNQRTGDSIKLENMRLEYTLIVNATAGVNFTRIIVLRDFMNVGAAPAIADVLQDTSSQAAQLVSPFLHSLGDRFEVLSDQVHCQVNNSESALVHRRNAYGINDHMLFKGPTAAIGDTWQGMIFVIAITDQPVNGPKLVMSSLVDYVDN